MTCAVRASITPWRVQIDWAVYWAKHKSWKRTQSDRRSSWWSECRCFHPRCSCLPDRPPHSPRNQMPSIAIAMEIIAVFGVIMPWLALFGPRCRFFMRFVLCCSSFSGIKPIQPFFFLFVRRSFSVLVWICVVYTPSCVINLLRVYLLIAFTYYRRKKQSWVFFHPNLQLAKRRYFHRDK